MSLSTEHNIIIRYFLTLLFWYRIDCEINNVEKINFVVYGCSNSPLASDALSLFQKCMVLSVNLATTMSNISVFPHTTL